MSPSILIRSLKRKGINIYFTTLGTNSSFNTSFVWNYEGDKRFTRLWDGSFVDSFFPNDTRVKQITKEEAIRLAKEYQRL